MSQLTIGGMPVYALCMAAAAVCSLVALWVSIRRMGLPRRLFPMLAAGSVLLGCAGARVYFIAASNLAGGYGMGGAALLSPYPFEYAMCGAVLGVLLAACLSAAAAHIRLSCVLDALALPGLCMIALARISEVFSDFGWGQVLSQGGFFPLAVRDLYGQWHGSVFFLEALCALGALAYAARVEAGSAKRFATALLWFSVAQVLCESLRAETIRWGFVRVQQVQCAVFALALLCAAAYRRRMTGRQAALRIGVFAACVAVAGGMEFALDKWPWPDWLCYAVMAAALGILGWNVQDVIRPAKGRTCAAKTA